MKGSLKTFSMTIAALILTSCGTQLPFMEEQAATTSATDISSSTIPMPKSTTPATPTPPAPPAPPAPPPPASPFEVKISMTYYANLSNVELVSKCSVPPGSPDGTVVNCTVSIPEGRLHYSHLIIETSTPQAGSCEFAYLRPYYYRASVDPMFVPNWDINAKLDCSKSWPDAPAGCYNGAATSIISGFPKFDHEVVLSNDQGMISRKWDIQSAFEQKRFGDNRWVSNTLKNRAQPLSIQNDGFIANTMQDYVFECRDSYADLVSAIVLTVKDINTGGPTCDPNDVFGCNQFPEWNSNNL